MLVEGATQTFYGLVFTSVAAQGGITGDVLILVAAYQDDPFEVVYALAIG